MAELKDLMWAGGIKTGASCCGCGEPPPRGWRWSFFCTEHGYACGACKLKSGVLTCPVDHDG